MKRNRIMKLFAAVAMALVLTFALTACGSSGSSSQSSKDAGSQSSASASAAGSSSAASASSAKAGDGEVYVLRVHHHDPQDSAIGRFLEDWAKEINEASNGRLDVQIFHGATLGTANQTISMVLDGTCDIGWGGQSNFDGEFPASEIITLPLQNITSSTQGTQVFWKLYEEYEEMQKEYENYKVLLISVGCPNGISTKDKMIGSVADISGMNIRINAGPINDFFQALGASPVSVAMGEVYQAIDNNTIDAITSDWHGIYSFSLYEVLNKYCNLNIMAGNQFMLMNKDSYNNLPEDLQKIIDEHSGAYLAEKAGAYWDEVTGWCFDAIEENGGEIYTLPDEEMSKLQSTADTIVEQWIADAEAAGLPGQEMYDRMTELIAEYAE